MYGQLWLPFPRTASSFILLLKHSDHKLTGDKQILIGPVKKCQLKRWPFFTVTPISGNTSWNLQWSCTIHLSWYCRLNCFYCSPLWNNIQNIHQVVVLSHLFYVSVNLFRCTTACDLIHSLHNNNRPTLKKLKTLEKNYGVQSKRSRG